MTYHRWRKARALVCLTPGPARDSDASIEHEQMQRIRELQLENSRLRNLVTDLLLEKVKLTERLNESDVRQPRAAGRATGLRREPW
jgi:hypothetical protein